MDPALQQTTGEKCGLSAFFAVYPREAPRQWLGLDC